MNLRTFVFWVWLPVLGLLILANAYLLYTLEQKKHIASVPQILANQLTLSSYGTEQVLGAQVDVGDARALIVEQFLTRYGSPMAPYSDYIVERADAYDIDYRLVVAISQCESNGGLRMPTRASHNAWGISVEDGQLSGATFRNWMFAIDWVSKYIKEKYHDYGLDTPLAMGAKWAPSSVAKGNSWANCVEFFMDKIE